MQKTANQLYKEYKVAGGTRTFKGWVEREKRKGFLNYEGQPNIPVNKPLNDSIQAAIKDLHNQAGYTDDLQNKYIFGVHRNVWWIIAGVAAGTAIVLVIYHKTHKSK